MKTKNNRPLGSRLRMGTLALCILIAGTSCQKQIAGNDGLAANRDVTMKKNKPGTMPIAQIAIDNGFSELVEALSYVDAEKNTGLVNMFMNGKDQYTVFAPTNAAFEALYAALSTPGATVDDITDLPADLVLAVLQYHVTDGRRASNSVVPKNGMKKISTLLPGASFSVNPSGMIQAVGSTANIVVADISASNGVVHVIDQVLLPIVP